MQRAVRIGYLTHRCTDKTRIITYNSHIMTIRKQIMVHYQTPNYSLQWSEITRQ